MRIGEPAERTGPGRAAPRFHERGGLPVPHRLPDGHRDFPPGAEPWPRYVRTAQALGSPLAEIARTGAESGAESGAAPDAAERLSELFRAKTALIDARTAELAAPRADLAGRVGTGCPPAPA
ncbi:MerR family transcriptional regulator [Kitasatospora sp. NPDC004272]